MFNESQEKLPECEEELLKVAWYTEPMELIQRVCDHLAKIIDQQKEVMDLKAQHFLPQMCNHSKRDSRMQMLATKRMQAKGRPAVTRMFDERQAESDATTGDT